MIETASLLSRDGLRIGSLSLSGRALLAPMAGVTDAGMRRAAHLGGASLVTSEMVAAERYTRGDRENRRRATGGGLERYGVQIAGRDPAVMAEAARVAADDGAALVDINMGCPARKVTGGYAGSALMREPDLARAIIEAVARAVAVPVTVKMRLGWDDVEGAPTLARIAEGSGAAAVTVHGRTRCQFYKGRADWRAVAAAKAAVGIPVIVNGDCGGFADAVTMLEQSGADAIMIGRAAIGRPWLVGMVADALRTGRMPARPSRETRAALALAHYRWLVDSMGPEAGVRHARKHLAGYADGEGIAAEDPRRVAIVRSLDAVEVCRLLEDLFVGSSLEAAA